MVDSKQTSSTVNTEEIKVSNDLAQRAVEAKKHEDTGVEIKPFTHSTKNTNDNNNNQS
jgi:hypothetical protein